MPSTSPCMPCTPAPHSCSTPDRTAHAPKSCTAPAPAPCTADAGRFAVASSPPVGTRTGAAWAAPLSCSAGGMDAAIAVVDMHKRIACLQKIHDRIYIIPWKPSQAQTPQQCPSAIFASMDRQAIIPQKRHKTHAQSRSSGRLCEIAAAFPVKAAPPAPCGLERRKARKMLVGKGGVATGIWAQACKRDADVVERAGGNGGEICLSHLLRHGSDEEHKRRQFGVGAWNVWQNAW